MNEEFMWANGESLTELLDQARQYAAEYVESLPTRDVYPSDTSIRKLSELDEPFPEASSDPQAVLAELHRIGSLGTVAQTSGRYFGFVDGGMLPVGLAAKWLADTWDQNTAHYVMSPVNSHLEDICEKWLVDLFQFPTGTAAGFVTGTTLANFSGLCAGRNELLRRRGWDLAKQGLYGAPKLRVIVGAGAHAAVYKSVSMLGLGTDNIEIVASDEHGRMRPERLPELDESALVVAQAGNVNSGAIDPVGEICNRVAKSESWVHVDGAFGLWARALPSLKKDCEGLEKADSWSVDAHKTLNVPYDSGIILCKDRKASCNKAFQASASYFQWSDHRDGMNYTPSMSKRARVIELWAVLKSLGRVGVQQLVKQLFDNAKYFAGQLTANGFHLHNEVVCNQVLVSCGEDELTQRTIEHIQKGGECWCGGSKWNGRGVIRISVCDWSTTKREIDRSVAAFVTARQKAEEELAHVD